MIGFMVRNHDTLKRKKGLTVWKENGRLYKYIRTLTHYCFG